MDDDLERAGDPITAIIGLGSNLGDREEMLRQAAARLSAHDDLWVDGHSRIYETEPHGPPQPRYLNAALRVRTSLGLEALLDVLLEVERSLGRVRAERWGPRTIDLDLLWAMDAQGASLEHHGERLVVPHAHLSERAFALAPLLDVAPELEGALGPCLLAAGGAPPRSDMGWE